MNASFIRQPFNFAYDAVTDAASTIVNTVGGIASGIGSTISDAAGATYSTAASAASYVGNTIADVFKAKEQTKKESYILIKVRYDNGTSMFFGPFETEAKATEFGDNLFLIKKAVVENCSDLAGKGLIQEFTVMTLQS